MALTGEEIVAPKPYARKAREQSSLTQSASHALYESHPLAQEGLEEGVVCYRVRASHVGRGIDPEIEQPTHWRAPSSPTSNQLLAS
jgi:hypothetical protein